MTIDDDGLAYVRSLTAAFTDAAARFGAHARRWAETADAGRAAWDDGAGRDVFLRFLDPHRSLLEATAPDVAAAQEAHDAALASAALADSEARRTAAHATEAAAAVERARDCAATARAETATARDEIARTQAMVHGLDSQLTGLGA